MKYATRFRPAQVDPTVFIAPGATVLGDVSIGAESSVWFQAVVRGDVEAIRIGEQTNVQDACVLHADPGFPCQLGSRVTLGHAAIVHGASIEDDCLIGMRALVMNGARVGAGSLVAAGAVVPEGMVVPAGSIVMGMPGRVLSQTAERHQEAIRLASEHYVRAAAAYRADAAGETPAE